MATLLLLNVAGYQPRFFFLILQYIDLPSQNIKDFKPGPAVSRHNVVDETSVILPKTIFIKLSAAEK